MQKPEKASGAIPTPPYPPASQGLVPHQVRVLAGASSPMPCLQGVPTALPNPGWSRSSQTARLLSRPGWGGGRAAAGAEDPPPHRDPAGG